MPHIPHNSTETFVASLKFSCVGDSSALSIELSVSHPVDLDGSEVVADLPASYVAVFKLMQLAKEAGILKEGDSEDTSARH